MTSSVPRDFYEKEEEDPLIPEVDLSATDNDMQRYVESYGKK